MLLTTYLRLICQAYNISVSRKACFLVLDTSQQQKQNISRLDETRQLYMLPHWDERCRSTFANSPGHSTLTPGQPVPALTPWHQVSSRAAAQTHMGRSLLSPVKSHQRLNHWHSRDYPARHPTLQGLWQNWSARRQFTVTGWGSKLCLQPVSQCGSVHNCWSRSIPEIHWHVAGMLHDQQATSTTAWINKPPRQFSRQQVQNQSRGRGSRGGRGRGGRWGGGGGGGG